jgi:hypothetical protein
LENSDDYSADGSFSEELKGSDSSPSSEEESSDDSSEKDSDGGSLHLCPYSTSMNRYRETKYHDSYIVESSSGSSKGSRNYSSTEEEDANYTKTVATRLVKKKQMLEAQSSSTQTKSAVVWFSTRKNTSTYLFCVQWLLD